MITIITLYFQKKDCSVGDCADWGAWGEFSKCTADCDGGIRVRIRFCIGEGECPGDDSDTDICNTSPCSGWTPWTQFNECSEECGGGIRTRTRICESKQNFSELKIPSQS